MNETKVDTRNKQYLAPGHGFALSNRFRYSQTYPDSPLQFHSSDALLARRRTVGADEGEEHISDQIRGSTRHQTLCTTVHRKILDKTVRRNIKENHDNVHRSLHCAGQYTLSTFGCYCAQIASKSKSSELLERLTQMKEFLARLARDHVRIIHVSHVAVAVELHVRLHSPHLVSTC